MQTIKPTLIVTRHPSLVEYLREQGLTDEHTRVIEHAAADDVRGHHVLGVLPYHLGAHAASVTEIPMRLTVADREAMARGDLTLERVRAVAGKPVTYTVREVPRGRVHSTRSPSTQERAIYTQILFAAGFRRIKIEKLIQGDFENPATINVEGSFSVAGTSRSRTAIAVRIDDGSVTIDGAEWRLYIAEDGSIELGSTPL